MTMVATPTPTMAPGWVPKRRRASAPSSRLAPVVSGKGVRARPGKGEGRWGKGERRWSGYGQGHAGKGTGSLGEEHSRCSTRPDRFHHHWSSGTAS